jgi:hypothetical protein
LAATKEELKYLDTKPEFSDEASRLRGKMGSLRYEIKKRDSLFWIE